MTRISLLAAGAALALCAGSAAQAQGLYFSGEGGISLMPDQSLSNTYLGPSYGGATSYGGGPYTAPNGTTTFGTLHERADTGYNWGAAVGYDIGDGFRAEISALHTMDGIDSVGGVPSSGHLDGTNIMLNGKMDVLHMADFQPYIGAGIGAESIGASGVAGLHGQSWRPAFQVEAGISHPISDDMSVFGEYRYTDAEDAKLSGGGMTAHQSFDNSTLIAGLTFHFGG